MLIRSNPLSCKALGPIMLSNRSPFPLSSSARVVPLLSLSGKQKRGWGGAPRNHQPEETILNPCSDKASTRYPRRSFRSRGHPSSSNPAPLGICSRGNREIARKTERFRGSICVGMRRAAPLSRQSRRESRAARVLTSARGGTRTHDLRLRRPTLYPTELRAQIGCRRVNHSNPRLLHGQRKNPVETLSRQD